MNSRRVTGVVFSVIGFTIAVLAGLFLALRVSSSEMDTGQLVVWALIAFIPVALFVGYGIYLYAKSAPPEVIPESTLQNQRDLLNKLKSQGQVYLRDVAQEFNVDAQKIREIVYELVALRVISGYVDWERGIMHIAEDEVLRSATTCAKCGKPITLDNSPTACKTCGMEYFLA
jgi:hypothetical protein